MGFGKTGADQRKEKSRRAWGDNLILVLFIAAFSAIAVFRYLSDDYPNTAISACYFISWRYGFIGRGFVGTLLEAFPYMSRDFIHKVCYFSEFLLTLVVLLWAFTVFSKCEQKDRIPVFAVSLIFLAAPFSPYFTYLWYNCGRLDVFLITIVFIQSALYILKPRGFAFFIIVLTALGMLIHTGHAFMYFSFSGALLLCDAVSGGSFRGKEDGHGKWTRFLPSVLNLLTCCILFSCFHFVSFVDRSYTAESMVADMQSRTDADLSIITENVDSWYFMDADEYVEFQKGFTEGRGTFLTRPEVLGPLLITLLLLLPVIAVVFTVWKNVLISAETTPERLIYLICSLSWLTLIPEFLLETDMGRYVAAGFMTQVLLILTLWISGNELIKSSLEKLRKGVLEKRALYLFFVFETISLGYLRDVSTLEISERIWSYVQRLVIR